MKSPKNLAVVGAVLSSALLSLNANAQISIPVSMTFDPNQFGAGLSGYGTGDVVIPGGATMSSTPVELDLSFGPDVTLTSLGFGYEYGIGLSTFSPEIQPGDDAFTFSVELLENGTLITPSFAYDIANPFTFGFDENNPFGFPVDNLGTGTSTYVLDGSLTFNEIAILLTTANPSPDGVGITDIGFQLGVNPLAVPDTTHALPLLSLGLLTLLGFGVRKMNPSRV